MDDVAWCSNNSNFKTHKVGLKKTNSLGIYDMSGNVREWCWDWYSSRITKGDVTDPTGAFSGSRRVLRGGCWGYSSSSTAVSSRDYYYPNFRNNFYRGFRIARSLR